MKNKVLALSIILLLTTISLTSITFAQAAGESQWIGDYEIHDASTNALLVQHDAATNTTTTISPVLPGADITVDFTVNILAGGEGNLKLSTSLSKTSGQSTYWTLESDDYTMGSQYNPAQQSTPFNWVEGSFEMSLRGTVSSSASASRPVTVVTLAGPSGSVLGQLIVTSTSAKMNTYLTLYSQKNANLNQLVSGGVDAGFIELYTNTLNASKVVANGGDVDSAIAILNGLDVANPPAGSTMQMLFLPLVGVTVAIAVIFLVLFLRIRGRIGYFQLVVEDQIKDLEGLTLRARKIDRAMSANLDSIKDRLKNLVGM
jgi:hypothetical protein